MFRYQSAITACVAFVMFMSTTAVVIDKIDSPNVEQGELDLEYSGFHTFDSQSAKNNLADTEALVAYAPTDRWEVDLGGFFHQRRGAKS